MVNSVNLVFEEGVGGVAAGLFFGNFGLQALDLGLQRLNPLFQFGHGNGIEIFADNHVGWLFWVRLRGPWLWLLLVPGHFAIAGAGSATHCGTKRDACMKAIEIREPGGPEVLQISELPMPEPATGQVLVKVHAAGVNRPDILQRQGRLSTAAGSAVDAGA